MDGQVTLCVWPDGQWCHQAELEQYAWKSDDYLVLKVPEELDDEDIDTYISSL